MVSGAICSHGRMKWYVFGRDKRTALNGIELVDLSAYIPIQHVEVYIYTRISKRDNQPLTVKDLIQAYIYNFM